MIIAVFNQKGGSGKTMLSVHLAVAAHLAGRKVAILDLDPQGSASTWRKVRGDKETPVVVKVPEGSLDRAIAGAAADGFDFVLLDSPPSITPIASRIVTAADFVLIPVRPQPFDVAAVPDTLRMVGKKPYAFVLSDCPQRAPEIDDIRKKLEKTGRVIGQVNNWRAMWRALVSGQSVAEFEPDGHPADEIRKLFEAILEEVK